MLQPTSVALGVVAVSLIGAIAQIIMLLLIDIFAPHLRQADWFYIIMGTVPMYLVGLPAALVFFNIGTPTAPTKRRMTLPAWIGVLAICFVLTMLGSSIGVAVNEFIARTVGVEQGNAVAELTQNTPLWANILCIGIAAPIVEEIVYRKLVIDRLHRYGDLFAVLVSGILFGAIHGNFSQFFYAMFVGIVFGLVYVQTGKLRYTIALHMAINLIGGVYTSEMQRNLGGTIPEDLTITADNAVGMIMLLAYYAFIILCFIIAPIALSKLQDKIHLRKPAVRLTAWQTTRIWLLNPAVWLLLVELIAAFVTLFIG